MKINGIAHIVLTVNRPELALPFYERLFGFLELKTVFRHERGAYFIGGKTAVAIVPAETPHDQAAFVQTRIGLHHLCFRAYAHGPSSGGCTILAPISHRCACRRSTSSRA